MNEIIYMAMAFIAGIAIGTIFFGGLWFTVQKLSTSKVPGLMFIGSFIVRFTIMLAGFYLVSQGKWQRVLLCLLGLLLARLVIMYITKSANKEEVKLHRR